MNKNILYHFLSLLALITFWSGLVYRVYALNIFGITISLILVIAAYLILLRFFKKNNHLISNKGGTSFLNYKLQITNYKFALLAIYIILIFTAFAILLKNASIEPIISPWQALPSYFFALYLAATLVLFFYLAGSKRFNTVLISLHYFLSFSITVIIYKIGYGFDPFIHRATLELIDKTGSVDPKPLYYLGQYGLITVLHKIFFIPIVWLDKWLVPVLAAALIPASLKIAAEKWFDENINPSLLIVALLASPFSFFIITAPQNLAFLFLLLAIIFGVKCRGWLELMIVYLLAAAAMLTHPIAGIPAIMFALALTVFHSGIKRFKRYWYYLFFIFTALSLPFAFAFLEKNTNAGQTPSLNETFFSLPKLLMPGQENFILNFIYLYGFNFKIIFFALSSIGIIIALRHKKECRFCFVYLLLSSALALAYFLTKKISFAYLIDYERSNFPDRVLLMSAFFLLPFILLSIHGLLYKLKAQNKFIKISFAVFAAVLISASLYLSYPRFDNYFNSRGFAASQSDIKAVNWIENNASSSDYVVLANQQVSAAALDQYGFKKYYNNKNNSAIRNPQSAIFYYPIPTGGELYQYYLDMVYGKPSRETAVKAMDLAGVNEAYFVLNKYWWAFDKILNEAKLEADSWQELDKKIYIFKYEKGTAE